MSKHIPLASDVEIGTTRHILEAITGERVVRVHIGCRSGAPPTTILVGAQDLRAIASTYADWADAIDDGSQKRKDVEAMNAIKGRANPKAKKPGRRRIKEPPE